MSLASSGSRSTTLGAPFPFGVSGLGHPARLDGADHDRGYPHSASAVLAALGEHSQALDVGLGSGQGDAAELLGEQAADGFDVVVVELDVEEFAEVLDRQAGADPDRAVVEVLDRRAVVGVGLVGDLPDDLLENVLN